MPMSRMDLSNAAIFRVLHSYRSLRDRNVTFRSACISFAAKTKTMLNSLVALSQQLRLSNMNRFQHCFGFTLGLFVFHLR